MRYFITIIAILTFRIANSQVTPISFVSKAYNFSIKEKKIDSAIKCYQDLIQSFPNYREAYVLNQIANWYLQIGDTAQAEYNYLKSMQVDLKKDSIEFGFGQTYSCEKLAGLYYIQKKYRKALTYMDYTQNEFKLLRAICQGGFGSTYKLQFQFKRAICYYGLNIKDSSIISLAPYIFRANNYYYLDSLEYNSISNFFAITLFELYDKCYVKSQMEESLNKIYYLLTIKGESNDYLRWANADCFINFLGIKINLDSGGSYGISKEDSIPEYISKDYLLNEFTNSRSYKIIME